MQLERHHHYPAKVDEVVGIMTDESLLCAKYREMEQPAPERVLRTEDAGVIEVRTRRCVRFPVPADAERLLVREPVVDSVERWDPAALNGARHATFEMHTAGLPVRATGTMVLTPDGDDGCDCEVVIDLVSDVPLIGGRIVAAVARGADELIVADHAANLSFLHRRQR